jgi:hypothetical protein
MMTPSPTSFVTTPRSCFRSVGWQMATEIISVKIKIVPAFILQVPISVSEFQIMLVFNAF